LQPFRTSPPTNLAISGDFTGKFLSALLASTLKVLTLSFSIKFIIKFTAVSYISSIFGFVSTAGLMDEMPNTFEISPTNSSWEFSLFALTKTNPSSLYTSTPENFLRIFLTLSTNFFSKYDLFFPFSAVSPNLTINKCLFT